MIFLTDIEKFKMLKTLWMAETCFHSNPFIIQDNVYFHEIKKLKTSKERDLILEIMFNELYNDQCDWLAMLRYFLDVDPIKKEHAGNWQKMKEDWFNWKNENLEGLKYGVI